MKTSETVSLAVFLLSLGGLATIGFAFFAFHRARKSQEKIEGALERVSGEAETAVRAAAAGDEPPAIAGVADYVRALGDLAEKLAKLSPPVAALLVSTIPFLFAATIVVVDILH